MMERGSLIRIGVILAAFAVLGTACVKEPAADSGGTAVTGTYAAEFAEQTEPYTGSEGALAEAEMEKEAYYMLQGTVVKAAGEDGVFALRADDGETYEIQMSHIRDVEVELEEDVQIAIACIGEPGGGLKEVTLVAALPEQEEWSILEDSGTTVSNAMSTFSIKTEDGRELSFLKDNCPIEEGALAGDSGDKVTVVYVNSQGTNFPIEIKKGESPS